VTHAIASNPLVDVVSAPSFMIAKIIQDGTQAFDIQWALSTNITQMSFNLSIIAFASFNILYTTL